MHILAVSPQQLFTFSVSDWFNIERIMLTSIYHR